MYDSHMLWNIGSNQFYTCRLWKSACSSPRHQVDQALSEALQQLKPFANLYQSFRHLNRFHYAKLRDYLKLRTCRRLTKTASHNNEKQDSNLKESIRRVTRKIHIYQDNVYKVPLFGESNFLSQWLELREIARG